MFQFYSELEVCLVLIRRRKIKKKQYPNINSIGPKKKLNYSLLKLIWGWVTIYSNFSYSVFHQVDILPDFADYFPFLYNCSLLLFSHVSLLSFVLLSCTYCSKSDQQFWFDEFFLSLLLYAYFVWDICSHISFLWEFVHGLLHSFLTHIISRTVCRNILHASIDGTGSVGSTSLVIDLLLTFQWSSFTITSIITKLPLKILYTGIVFFGKSYITLLKALALGPTPKLITISSLNALYL